MPFKNKTVRRHNIAVSIIYTCVVPVIYVSKQCDQPPISGRRLDSFVRNRRLANKRIKEHIKDVGTGDKARLFSVFA